MGRLLTFRLGGGARELWGRRRCLGARRISSPMRSTVPVVPSPAISSLRTIPYRVRGQVWGAGSTGEMIVKGRSTHWTTARWGGGGVCTWTRRAMGQKQEKNRRNATSNGEE